MKKIIYTAIMGKYDELKEPLVITPGWEYICLTNNPELKSNIWSIKQVNFREIKEVRQVKIQTPFEYDLSIWVDGSIEVNCDLDDFVKLNHIGNFTLMKHPHRACVYEEATACLKRKKDLPHTILEQMSVYKQDRYPAQNGMVATGLLIRNNTPQVKAFCERWWKQVERYSKRDQLSFNYTLNKFPIRINLIPFNVLEKEFILYLHKKII